MSGIPLSFQGEAMPTRRDFLALAASAAAVRMAPRVFGQAATAPADAERPLGWAVVGIGSLTMGQILPAIANCKKSKLVALVTGHPQKAVPIVAKFGLNPANVYSYETYDKLAENPAVDVIYIVLPNGMHAEYTIRGVKAGKHVLCEKPMANTSAECRQMIDAAKAAKRQLMIAYRVRREPNNMKAIELCRDGSLGKPQLMMSDHGFWMGNPAVWRLNKKLAGGGPIMDIGIYGLNAARYLTGEEPVSVTAQQIDNPSDPRFKEVEEGMVWTMRFPSGVLATLSTSYNIRSTNRIRMVFDKGMFDLEPATGYHGIQLRAPNPIKLPDIDQFVAQMDYFSDCVVNGREPITPGEEGLRDIRIIEAIYEAARTGQRVNLT
jgi:predicted dehydrogenase